MMKNSKPSYKKRTPKKIRGSFLPFGHTQFLKEGLIPNLHYNYLDA